MEENKPKNIEVETYADDMAGVMQGSDAGLIKKIIKEQSAYEESERAMSPEATKNKIYLYVGVFFTLLSVATISYLIATEERMGTVNIEAQFIPIIFTDETSFVAADGQARNQIVGFIRQATTTGDLKEGGIEGIYVSENNKVVGLSRFTELIEAHLPKEKVPLFGEGYLMGGFNGITNDFFILLGVKEFSEVFNEMRVWEKKMLTDLHGLFGYELNQANSYLLAKNFEDGIVENKNARILNDNEGNIVLMYVFADNDYIVVANTEQVVSEVMLRLASDKVKN